MRACPTWDNIFVALDIAVLFRCKPDDDSIFNFCYRLSINQLNEQLEAAITERVRILIRSKTHLEVNQIKGVTNTASMKDFLNQMFGGKGLEFTDIIITEVQLPEEIKQPLDLKAQFGSLNEKEREQYNYDMRLIDDDEELQALKQRRYEQRDSIKEDFQKQLTLNKRDLELIRANAHKSVAEINANGAAEQAQIKADSELQIEIINGDTLVTKSKAEAEGKAEAELIEVEATNECNIKLAEKMLEVSQIKAQTIETVGQGEQQISKVIASRRKYEHLNAKLDVIKSFKNNPNLRIFGSNNDDVMSQLAAYRIDSNGR